MTEKKTLKEWRIANGLKQKELAELAGCSTSLVSHIESGQSRLTTRGGYEIAAALGVSVDQIVAIDATEGLTLNHRGIDGFAPSAPRKDLRWWRERRALTLAELSSLSGVYSSRISQIESGKARKVQSDTRRKLAQALGVDPGKLALPGERKTSAEEDRLEALLRADLRGARSALKKAYDFMRNDAAITFRYQDTRDAILPDIEREVRGL